MSRSINILDEDYLQWVQTYANDMLRVRLRQR